MSVALWTAAQCLVGRIRPVALEERRSGGSPVPKVSGVVIPASGMSASSKPAIHQTININGVTDFDSFKKSSSQIAAEMAGMMAMASRRNRG